MDNRFDYFMELIKCNYNLHYWKYDSSLHSLESDCENDLFSSTFFDFVGFHQLVKNHIANGKTLPLILEAESNLLWIAGFESAAGKLKHVYFIGPIFSGRDSYLILHKKLDSYDLSIKLRASFHRMFEHIPTIPHNITLQYGVMLHYCLNKEQISPNEIAFSNAGAELPKPMSLTSSGHAGIWLSEQMLLKMLSEGDIRYKEALQKSAALSYGVKADIGDSLRSHKNNFLVLLTLCSRACIVGGLSPDISYDLNDYYAQRIELCKSMTDVNKLCSEMLEDYVVRVQEVRRDSSVSDQVRNSCAYIKSHLTEAISLETLAKRSGYTEYYFSHKFKKEMNCTVNDYILNEKINHAKIMLSGTSESIQSISDCLAFSNRSYFYTCFQKLTGMSPSEYRAQKSKPS